MFQSGLLTELPDHRGPARYIYMLLPVSHIALTKSRKTKPAGDGTLVLTSLEPGRVG